MDTVPSLARVTLIGSICSPAEVKFTSNNRAITSFRVRVDDVYKGRDGAQQVRSAEHPLTWWGEHLVSLGQLVYVEARLSSRSYESRGETRFATEIVVEKMVHLGGVPGEGSTEDRSQPSASTRASRSTPPSPPPVDDDIPF